MNIRSELKEGRVKMRDHSSRALLTAIIEI